MAAGSPSSNVYTVLMFVAFVALVTAAVFIYVKSGELFPLLDNPFTMPPQGGISSVMPADVANLA